ncbi:hypothetical protein Slin15195_G095990 [Septoria linicola]|uniref:Uncharacterized protein n=1 Tax=Septoria linicola TaxID=215465 RepID=A0A9Q9EMP9_9PEZI|nr:hypothetical protein Slin14017_G059080 [Septoria linicola]USW56280.1 hypothetical protein Slin15195_G095990 [Septoria linicola]
MRPFPSVLFVFGFSSCVSSQLLSGVAGSADQQRLQNQLCNKTFADANATGIYTITPDVTDVDTPISWGGTVFQSNDSTSNRIELSLWFSSGGQNYSDNFDLGYDACYLWPAPFSFNTYVRGQSDNGSCIQTLDETCVSDLLAATTAGSARLTGIPTNLSTNSLPDVCSQLASELTTNFPDSCKPYFNSTGLLPVAVYGGLPALGGPLTGNQSLVDRAKCKLNTTSNEEFSLMWTQFGEFSLDTYYLANYFVIPVITAFMPIADSQRQITLNTPKSFMSCGRTSNLTQGSIPIPAAPAPELVETFVGSNGSAMAANGTSSNTTDSAQSTQENGDADGGSISGGAIAGIVIGVVLGLAVVGAAVWFFVFRKRKGQTGAAELSGYGAIENKETRQNSVEAPNNNSISEMGGTDGGQYQPGWKTSEAVELPTYRNPVELPGNR